ncbi:MAG: O-antigen ligase family protein [Candidatus Levybacteria bacterium]|nr:O-antigen ligase family protein [Candidatus Levybacteria bacterium]
MTRERMRYIYLLLIFLLPTQFGKHFWPSFSFIAGLRVDYLSPTLYITDILIFILFVLCAYKAAFHTWKILNSKSEARNPKQKIKSKKINNKTSFEFIYFVFRHCFDIRYLIFGFLIIAIIIGIFFAKNQPVALYGFVKVLEMGFFGWYTSRVVGKTIAINHVVVAFGLGAVFESFLAISQFYSHGSLGGVFYFFGERTFSSLTPGIANASISGQLFLRPYGTLPHPNVLAGFLLIGIIFITMQWKQFGKNMRIFALSVLFSAVIALLLTLSRTTIFLFFLLSFFSIIFFLRHPEHQRGSRKILRFTQNDKILWGIGGLGIVGGLGIFGSVLIGRFMSTSFLEEAFVVRADLFKNAWWMISNHPFFGVGLMNFLVRLPSYQHTYSYYQYLQPVHNIFLLIFAEIGVIGFSLILYLLYKTLRHVYYASVTPVRLACLLMLISIFFLGMFDHYFLTLQSGQLLLAFVIGVCWSLKSIKRKKK